MKCLFCNHYHALGEECIHDDMNKSSLLNLNIPLKPDPILPSYEPPKFEFNAYRPDPIIPPYDPPKFDFNTYKPDPIVPPYDPPKFDFNTYKPDPILPSYEPPKFDFNTYKPDPILPSYEPPKFEFNTYKPDPILPKPPDPVYDLQRNLIGWKSDMENTIRTTNGSTLSVDPGGYVRDPINNLVGQMGPLNTISPPNFPEMPDYGPPQAGPEAWDPGYSPIKPLG